MRDVHGSSQGVAARSLQQNHHFIYRGARPKQKQRKEPANGPDPRARGLCTHKGSEAFACALLLSGAMGHPAFLPADACSHSAGMLHRAIRLGRK